MLKDNKFIKEYIKLCNEYKLYIQWYWVLENLQDNERIDYELFDNWFWKQVMYYWVKELSKKQIQKMLYNLTRDKAIIRQKRYRDKKKKVWM